MQDKPELKNTVWLTQSEQFIINIQCEQQWLQSSKLPNCRGFEITHKVELSHKWEKQNKPG